MDDVDGPALAAAVTALEAASHVAGTRLCTDPVWDLVYCDLGLAILAIQAATDAVPATDTAGDPAGAQPADAAQARPAGEVAACVAWVEAAAQVLRQADLGARPGLAVAVTAVADAQAAMRDVAA